MIDTQNVMFSYHIIRSPDSMVVGLFLKFKKQFKVPQDAATHKEMFIQEQTGKNKLIFAISKF